MAIEIDLPDLCVQILPSFCERDNRAEQTTPHPTSTNVNSPSNSSSSPSNGSSTLAGGTLSSSIPTPSISHSTPSSTSTDAPPSSSLVSNSESFSKPRSSSHPVKLPVSTPSSSVTFFGNSSVIEPLSSSPKSITTLETSSTAVPFQTSSSSAKTIHNRIIMGSSIGAACFLLLILALIFLLRMRRKFMISSNEMDIGQLKDGDEPATEYPSYHATHDEKLQTYTTNDEEIALPFPYSQPNYASEVSLSQYSTTSSPAPSIFGAVASPEIIGPIFPSRSPDPNPFHADDASSVDVVFDKEPLFLHGADPTRFKATSPTPEGNLSRSSTVKSTGGRSSLHSRITLGVAM